MKNAKTKVEKLNNLLQKTRFLFQLWLTLVQLLKKRELEHLQQIFLFFATPHFSILIKETYKV